MTRYKPTRKQFDLEITVKDWPIQLTVIYDVWFGSTSTTGPNPDCFEMVATNDGTGSNIWKKLDEFNQHRIIEYIWEHGNEQRIV